MKYSKAIAEVILFEGNEFMTMSGYMGGGITCSGFDCSVFATTGQGNSGKFTCTGFDVNAYSGVKTHGSTYQCHQITRIR